MPKIQESKGRFSLTIPKEYIEQCNLRRGDKLTVSYNERGNLELKKILEKKENVTGVMHMKELNQLKEKLKFKE